MIKSINDIYREKIISMKESGMLVSYLSSLNSKQLEYISGIMISDLYKMFFHIEKFHNNSSLNILENNIDYYKEIFKFDKDIIAISSAATSQFYDMDLINKSILMDDLQSQNKDGILIKANRFHVLDKAIYSFRYDLSYFIDLYENFIEKYKSSPNLVVEFIADKLSDLKVINYEKYTTFILEFIRVYYKCSLYRGLENSEKDIYLSLIENSSLKELYERLSANYGLLCILIENYLKYSTSKEDVKDNINSCFYNNADIKVQKKLKFNDKKNF